jgi:carbonic anhydrase
MHHHRVIHLGICLVAILLLAPLGGARDDKAHWTYSGEHGPEHWGDLDPGFAVCNSGSRQSPIDISGAKPSDLPAMKFQYQATPLNIINNGHTIQVNYAPGSAMMVGGATYELKQFHFHHPSEEKIDGKGFAMVAHLVHANAQGKLAVVAVLLEEGSASPLIQTVWRHIPAKAGPEDKHPDVPINIADLLPADRGYYTFMGSLTTPPCSEDVSWFVLKKPVTLSKEQVEAFGKLYPLNARPIQPLKGRLVLESK